MSFRPKIASLDIVTELNGRKGRGAASNRDSRYDACQRVRIDDGWELPALNDDGCDDAYDDDFDGSPAHLTATNAQPNAAVAPRDAAIAQLKAVIAQPKAANVQPKAAVAQPKAAVAQPEATVATQFIVDHTKTILARNRSPDVPFDRSINPYRGCEHGCVYCFARPTHAYLGLSPGLDFETKIHIKPLAPKLLARALNRPAYRCQTIAMGTNTDPYQPIERKLRITRQILEVLAAHAHPVSFVTKSALIRRDIDILAPMAARGLTHAYVSITSLDNALCAKLEPRAAAPHKRFATVRSLAQAGIPVGVLVAPVIPFITDGEIESICEAAVEAGASAVGYVLLRLPLEVENLVEEWLHVHVPLKAKRVMSLMRSMRGGKAYDSRWGWRQSGSGSYAELIAQRFSVARKRHRIERGLPPLITEHFTRPAPAGHTGTEIAQSDLGAHANARQLKLF